MRVDLFDFDLPTDRIALRPARPRDAARMLLVEGVRLSDRGVLDLPDILRPGDVLVFNDTGSSRRSWRDGAGRRASAPPSTNARA